MLFVFLSGGVKISPINFKLCRVGLLVEALAPIGKNRSYNGIEADYNSNQGGMGGKIAIPMSSPMNGIQTLEWRFEPFIVALSFSQQQLVYGASFGLARKF